MKRFAAVLMLAGSGAVLAGPAEGMGSAASAAATLPGSVSAVVSGILAYTRWPGEAAPIRLCTLGRGVGVEQLLAAADIGSEQRPVKVRPMTAAVEAAAGPCDALYVGNVSTAAHREVLKALAGRPVLLLGEGAEFCSDGGMFCLAPGTGAVRFNANLDAIARSGLRVNPMVLRIARGNAGPGS
jgi:hypothetical protein